ncbi:MAG TPA: alpha-amylase family glycosyl hydrolase [Acidimicrobiales bacterium]|nr:alpha-amylase family glycosyl hydrolase [Acidimicrobiales bacterium]
MPDMVPWWRGATIYHVYVRSFADTNGDGFGDLPGVRQRLGYLQRLGVDGIWLSPTMPSPDTDWGYDVSGYCGVHPELGTLDDLDALVREAGALGIRVLLDLVPNHTSDKHPWFVDALSAKTAKHREYYVWVPPKPGGGPPNNWVDATGQPAWAFDERSGEYYLHNFLATQPDLNWWHQPVHEEFERVIRFWFDRGIAGFRVDVANGIYKDAKLRDNPPSAPGDLPESLRGPLRPVYSSNRPEVHGLYRQWRRLADSYEPGRVLLGETWTFDFGKLAAFYGVEGPELHLAFNFPFFFSGLRAPELASVVEAALEQLPEGATPVWTASNHDAGRFPTRWCHGDQRAVKAALVVLATLPGTLVLYYGDELGMQDVDVPFGLWRDEISIPHPERPSRDRCRTPMPWSAGKNAGFTAQGVNPWLPLGEHATTNVHSEEEDPASVLNFWYKLARLRKSGQLGGTAPLERVHLDEQVWAYRVGEVVTVANLASGPAKLPGQGLEGLQLLLSTDSSRQGAPGDALRLQPWEALVLARKPA